MNTLHRPKVNKRILFEKWLTYLLLVTWIATTICAYPLAVTAQEQPVDLPNKTFLPLASTNEQAVTLNQTNEMSVNTSSDTPVDGTEIVTEQPDTNTTIEPPVSVENSPETLPVDTTIQTALAETTISQIASDDSYINSLLQPPIILTVNPKDDSYVNSLKPLEARGSNNPLHVNGDAARTKHSYLRFELNLPAGAMINQAKLRLQAATSYAFPLHVAHVPNNNWSEVTLNWNNRPAHESTLASIAGTTAGSYAEFDVSAAVKTGGLHSFALIAQNGQGGDASLVSKESVTGQPELVVTYQAAEESNGQKPFLRTNGESNRTKTSYLKFTLAGIPNGAEVVQADVVLLPSTSTIKVYELHATGTNWDQNSLTRSNAPLVDPVILSSISSVTASTRVSFSVKNVVRGNGTYAFALQQQRGVGGDSDFVSREAVSGQPALVVAYRIPCVQGQVDAMWVSTCGALLGGWRLRKDVKWTTSITDHETIIGRPLDVIRQFYKPGELLELKDPERSFVANGRKLLIGYKPAHYWSWAASVEKGGLFTVTQQIRNLAQSFKKTDIATRKIMIILEHEPEKRITEPLTTTQHYRDMWENVHTIFKTEGVTNVIWVWDVQNTPYNDLRRHLPNLWPGNDKVDWVMWNPYVDWNKQTDSPQNIVDVIDDGYNWFKDTSTDTVNYLSKPWGFGEWGIGVNGYTPTAKIQCEQYNALNSKLNVAVNPYSKLKLLAAYDERESAIQGGVASTAYQALASSAFMKQLLPQANEPSVNCNQ